VPAAYELASDGQPFCRDTELLRSGCEIVDEVDGASVLRNLQPDCPGHLLRLNPRALLSPAFCFVGSPGRFLNDTET
jgi:hypothetical protein